MQTQHLIPQPPLPRRVGEPEAHRATQRTAATAVGAASGRPAPHGQAPQPPRRSKADSLRLVRRLKQTIAVGAIVAFSVFGGLVATRLPFLGTAASASTSSPTTTSSSTGTSTSTSSNGFLGQGSNGSGVSGSSSPSSATSSAPISGTGVS